MIPGSANPLLLGQTGSGATQFEISKSLRFNSADSAYLNRTPSSAGNRKTFTFSCWVKRVKDDATPVNIFAAGANNFRIALGVGTTAYLQVYDYNGSSFNLAKGSTASFRDFSAWYHIVVAIDTTDSTADNRVKMYINGSRITALSGTNVNPSQNLDTYVNNSSNAHSIGWLGTGNYYLDAYLAEINFVDGSALDPTSFGAFDDNGVWQATDTAGLSFGTNGFRLKFADNSSNAALGTDSSGNSNTWTVNNLSAVVAVPNLGFDAVTYTGNGGTQSISSLAFQPDFVWLKRRNLAASHNLFDSVRGATKFLGADGTNGEQTGSDRLTAFGSNGFTLGSNAEVNNNNDTYVAWCWKAGGAASSNTDGSITSSVSANAAYGFSIVKYNSGSSTGNYTLGHGLSSAPKLIIHKQLTTGNWWVFHEGVIDNTAKYLQLNSAAAIATNSAPMWGASLPTSSVFGVRVGDLIGTNTDAICYAWSEVAGYSKFGTWQNNNSQTGTYVELGFRPKFILLKNSDNGENWYIMDSARKPANVSPPDTNKLQPNTSAAEGSLQAHTATIDFLDSGFQIKTTNPNSGEISFQTRNYIYAAFADTGQSAADIDSLIDTPTNAAEPSDTGVGNEVVGNYATLNPLSKSSQTNIVLANGNLEASNTSSSGQGRVNGTIAMSSGKWYFEATVTGSSNFHEVGIIKTTENLSYGIGFYAGGYSYNQPGTKFNNNATPSYGASYTTGDTIGVAFDADNGTLAFYKNGASQGTAFTGLSGTYYPTVGTYSSGANFGWTANFGQRAFAYQNAGTNRPSADYKSLNTANFPTPTIADGSKYFDTKLWTGDGASTRTISNYDFSPDFIWIKNRTTTGWQHVLYDQIRGAGTGSVTKSLSTDSTRSEASGNDTNHGYLSGYTSDGFDLVKGSQGGGDYVNHNGWAYVAWAWDGGDSNTTIAVGGLNSSVYDQSQTWSNGGGTGLYSGSNWTGTFDGTPATTGSDIAQSAYITNSGSSTLTFSSNISGVLKATACQGSNNASTGNDRPTITLSDGTVQRVSGANNSPSEINFGSVSNISSLTIAGTSAQGMNLIKLTLDGKLLVDSGVSVANVPAIASQVRAQPSAGFSICTYSGSGSNGSFGHGLNAVPELVIVKCRSHSQNWAVQHSAYGPTKYTYLNSTNEARTTGAAAFWNNTAPTNSTVSVGTDNDTNASGRTYVAYCFAPVAGYSAMGSYVGNGSTDGPFVYTGFRPKWILLKNITSTYNWYLFDTVRSTFNVVDDALLPNSSSAEATDADYNIDILSNGFKLRNSNVRSNASSNTYLYIAFAENPFQTNGGLAR